MLSYILSALSLARHAVAFTLVAGAAATTLVAGSVDQIAAQPQHQTGPMTTTAPTTMPEPTARAEVALTVSAKSATPEITTRPSTNPKPETSPRPEPRTSDTEALVKDCLTKYAALKTSTTAGTAASEACRRAIEASGLTSTEFWTRFTPKAQPTTAPVTPSTNPSTKIEALVQDCFAKYNAAKDSATGFAAASDACRRAIEASGLSATQFWAKFGSPQAPKSTPKPTATPTTPALTTLTRYCLSMHATLTTTSSREQIERATTVCDQAIAEAKLTPTEFWSKFSAYR